VREQAIELLLDGHADEAGLGDDGLCSTHPRRLPGLPSAGGRPCGNNLAVRIGATLT
jgi:hypothetical protein